jgi:hypothetical protein
MDIHAPEHPIRSFKDILVHLAIVTTGIPIALSLEGLLEWNHQRHLVREARENLRSEVKDNRMELANQLAFMPDIQKGHRKILRWLAQSSQVRKNTSQVSFSLTFRRAELSHTSWTTAQVVGALSLMRYSEVKRAADLYELQEEFGRLQSRAEDATISALTFFETGEGDPTKASDADVEAETRKVKESLAALAVQHQIGVVLIKRYDAYLAQER